MRIEIVSGRAFALLLLAYSLVKVLLKRAFGTPTGLAVFRENYDPDGLPPLEASEREAMESFPRCIACGRCNAGEGTRIASSAGAYPGLMQVVLASTRSMPDYDAAERALAHVPEDVLEAKEGVCPTRVPFVPLARFVRDKARLVREKGATRPGS